MSSIRTYVKYHKICVCIYILYIAYAYRDIHIYNIYLWYINKITILNPTCNSSLCPFYTVQNFCLFRICNIEMRHNKLVVFGEVLWHILDRRAKYEVHDYDFSHIRYVICNMKKRNEKRNSKLWCDCTLWFIILIIIT